MKGCLANPADLDNEWNNFIGGFELENFLICCSIQHFVQLSYEAAAASLVSVGLIRKSAMA